jgi:hypothetical protein
MASDVSICSAALARLGDLPIASLTENSPRAILCNALYADARTDVLRSHLWNCLTKRVILSPVSTAPVFGWTSRFTLPGDCLRVIGVGNEQAPEDYRIEGREVLANTTTLRLVYVADKDAAEWDAGLVEVMTARMTAELAYPITKSATLADSKAQAYERLARRNRSIDGQENPPEDWGDSPFLQVR